MDSKFSPTTSRDLIKVVQSTKPENKPLPGYEGTHLSRFGLGICMDECYPGLYIGDLGAARSVDYLRRLGITHVLNAAAGEKFGAVNTDLKFYDETGIKYSGIYLLDIPTANAARHFTVTADFIEDALSNGGKILVHCYMGISRSSTIACAFLMLKRNMTAAQALEILRKSRGIFPNVGFLSQLAQLDNELRSKRETLPKF